MSAEHPSVPSRAPHPALLALENAPVEDEEISAAEAAEATGAREEMRAGVPLVSHEAVRRSWLG